jgi:hypothetical protein
LGVGNFKKGNVLARYKVVTATLKHEGGKVFHHRLSLEVKVAKCFIRAPVTDEADNVGVNVGKQKGHGTAGAERFGNG